MKSKNLDIGRLVCTVGWSEDGLFYDTVDTNQVTHFVHIATVEKDKNKVIRIVIFKLIVWVGVAA